MNFEAEGSRFSAVVVDDGLDCAGERAVRTAGGRVAARLRWQEAADVPGADVLLLAAEGVAEARLADTLPELARAAAMAGMVVVVTLGRDAIDVVTASLIGEGVVLLCEVGEAEVVAALMLASDGARPAVRENDRERLDRLGDEVDRIAELLRWLTQRERGRPAEVADRRPEYGAEPAGEVAIDAAEVRRAIRSRRLRDGFFEAGLFADPAWDVLLDLFAAELEGGTVSVSSLCIAAAVAPTTALRWIGRMTQDGLLERRADPADRRRAFMVLTERSRTAMRSYAAAARRAGVPFA
jgi:hypothetical protein